MNRVETINVNGIVFSIDDDAYAKLSSYLEALGKNFENEKGGREIIADIEARISELFAEREGGGSRVVTINDVSKMIETLGTPEDITGADVEETTNDDKHPRQPQPQKSQKRLFRDTDKRYLGGVCAGFGAYFGINPIIIRLIFIFLVLLPLKGCNHTFMFGTGFNIPILIYIILWIVIPKAKTIAQKLEMRGEPVNISNIEKNIKESFSDPSLKNSFRNFLNEAGVFFGNLFGIIGRIIGFLIGVALFCCGIGFLIALVSLFFMQDFVFSHKVEWDLLSFTELLQHIISPLSYIVLMVCGIIAATLLIFAFLYWGMKLMFGFKLRYKQLHVTMFVLWIVAIVAGIITCIAQVRNFAWSNDAIVETRQIVPSDTLYLTLAPTNMQLSNNPMDIYFDKDARCFYGKPNLYMQKSDDEQTKLRLYRKSRGESKRAAYQYAENIEYSVNISDSLLIFDQYFTVTPQNKWKFQTLSLTLYVPEGTIIITDDESRLLRWFRWRSNNKGIWIMTENNGLQRVENK